MFRSKNDLIDFLKITEGYLVEDKKRKFDKIFRTKNKELLENFRAFDGRDTVYFSMDYITYITRQQSKIFEEFLHRRFLNGRTRVTAETENYYNLILNDLKVLDKITGLSNDDLRDEKTKNLEWELYVKKTRKNLQKAIAKNDKEYINKLIIERLIVWFKFFFSRIILQRYCNIPAGILVVKIADYSTRMITEIYSDKKLIDVKRNLNDGTSTSFEGDGLVNLFLYMFNTFLYGRKEKILEQIEFNINTITDNTEEDDSVRAIISNMKKEIENSPV